MHRQNKGKTVRLCIHSKHEYSAHECTVTTVHNKVWKFDLLLTPIIRVGTFLTWCTVIAAGNVGDLLYCTRCAWFRAPGLWDLGDKSKRRFHHGRQTPV